MWANGVGEMGKGAEATGRRPATPPVEFSFGKLAFGVCVNGLESLAKTHRAAKFSVLTTEIFTLLLTLLSEVPNVAAQAPERTFEIGALTRKLAAHLIQCLAGQHHKVELMKTDPVPGTVVGRTLDVGPAPIHGNRLDLGGIAALLAERLGKGPEGL